MGKSKATNLSSVADRIRSYRGDVETSYVEPEHGKRVWKQRETRYNLEGYTADEREDLDYKLVERLFEETQSRVKWTTKPLDMAPSRLTFSDLTSDQLWQVLDRVRLDKRGLIRAKVFAELMRREGDHPGLASFVVDELARNDLKPTWRNTLIFATEHLDFLDTAQRQRLRDLLLGLVTVLATEWHPRSKLAQEAALRRYGSLIDNNAEVGRIVDLLSTGYPLTVRLIALQSIQNVFATTPPSVSLREDLRPLRGELQRMVDFFFRQETLARSEEDFDLGLTALEALTRLGDPVVLQFVARVKDIGRSWVARHLEQFLRETRTAWPEPDPASSSDPARAVRDALDVLQTVQSQLDR